MLNIITPLPGTPQFDDLEAQSRVITRDWELYDAQHVVFRPRQMSPSGLLRETLHGNRRFYSTSRAVRSIRAVLTQRDRSSWDRMLVPLPFARVDIVYGEALKFDRRADVAAGAERLEAALNAVESRAERLGAGRVP